MLADLAANATNTFMNQREHREGVLGRFEDVPESAIALTVPMQVSRYRKHADFGG